MLACVCVGGIGGVTMDFGKRFWLEALGFKLFLFALLDVRKVILVNTGHLVNAIFGQEALVAGGDEGGVHARCCHQGGGNKVALEAAVVDQLVGQDRKSTRLNSSHVATSYAVFC